MFTKPLTFVQFYFLWTVYQRVCNLSPTTSTWCDQKVTGLLGTQVYHIRGPYRLAVRGNTKYRFSIIVQCSLGNIYTKLFSVTQIVHLRSSTKWPAFVCTTNSLRLLTLHVVIIVIRTYLLAYSMEQRLS